MFRLETAQISDVLNSREFPSWESGVLLATAAKDNVLFHIQDNPSQLSDIRVQSLLSRAHLDTGNWILLNAIVDQNSRIIEFSQQFSGDNLFEKWILAAQNAYDSDPTKESHAELFAPLLVSGSNPIRVMPDEVINSYSKTRDVCIRAVSYGDANFPSHLITTEIESPRKERMQSIKLLERTISILRAQKDGIADLGLLFPQVDSVSGLIPHLEMIVEKGTTIFDELRFTPESQIDEGSPTVEAERILKTIDAASLSDIRDLTTEISQRCAIHRGKLVSGEKVMPVLIKEVKEEDQFRVDRELEFYKEWRETDLRSFLLHSPLPRMIMMNGKPAILMIDLREAGLTLSQDGFEGDCLSIFDRDTNFAYNEPAKSQLEQYINTVMNLYSRFWRMGWDIADQANLNKGIAARYDTDNFAITHLRLFDFGNFIRHPSHRPNDFAEFIQRIFANFVPFYSPEFKASGISILFHNEKVTVPRIVKSRNSRFPYLVAKDLALRAKSKHELTSQLALYCGMSYREASKYAT